MSYEELAELERDFDDVDTEIRELLSFSYVVQLSITTLIESLQCGNRRSCRPLCTRNARL